MSGSRWQLVMMSIFSDTDFRSSSMSLMLWDALMMPVWELLRWAVDCLMSRAAFWYTCFRLWLTSVHNRALLSSSFCWSKVLNLPESGLDTGDDRSSCPAVAGVFLITMRGGRSLRSICWWLSEASLRALSSSSSLSVSDASPATFIPDDDDDDEAWTGGAEVMYTPSQMLLPAPRSGICCLPWLHTWKIHFNQFITK